MLSHGESFKFLEINVWNYYAIQFVVIFPTWICCRLVTVLGNSLSVKSLWDFSASLTIFIFWAVITAQKVSVCGVFLVRFPRIRTRKTPITDIFHAVNSWPNLNQLCVVWVICPGKIVMKLIVPLVFISIISYLNLQDYYGEFSSL